MGKGWGYSSGSAVAVEGWVSKTPTGPVMQFTKDKNDKPPSGGNGGLTWLINSLTLELHLKRDGSLTDCSSLVNHPTTPDARLIALDGETTRRANLNLDRGGEPLGAQRIVGKRESQRGNP
jgi:hypothetical protein